MAGAQNPHIVSDAEIKAALAQAEADTAAIPSLDDGKGERFVPIPVPAIPRAVSQVELPPEPRITAPASAGSSPATPEPPAAAQTQSLGQRLSALLCRVLDNFLWAINRPLDGLSPQVRSLVGWLALTTIVVAATALVVLPRLCPRRDPLNELAQRGAALRATLDRESSAPASH